MPQSINIVETFPQGWSWALASSGTLACRAHALRDGDGRVWLVDPLDGDNLDGLLRELGPVAGVIVLLDRHLRDAPEIARRHGVPLYVPPGEWRRGNPRPSVAITLVDGIAGCPFEFLSLVKRDGAWLEQALWWPGERILIVAEALGASEYCLTRAGDPFGVHPMLRLGAPNATLATLDVEPALLLLGHGALVAPADVAPATLSAAVRHVASRGRRTLPRVLARLPKLVAAGIQARRSGRGFSC